MNILRNIRLKGAEGKPMLTDIYYNSKTKNQPIIIFCHGFKGFKDWGHFDLIGQKFAEQGFTFLKFNFSHNGTTIEHPSDFKDLEAFGNNTYTKELDDLKMVLDFVENDKEYLGDWVDRSEIYLIGHSKGGGAVILKSNEDKRVKKVISWAAVGKYGTLLENKHIVEELEKHGVFYIMNGRTKQEMPMYKVIFDDFIKNKARLNIPKAAAEINIPWLIVHGNKDQAVAFSTALALHKANESSKLLEIKDGDHTFGGKHPWDENSLPKDCQFVVQKCIEFLKH